MPLIRLMLVYVVLLPFCCIVYYCIAWTVVSFLNIYAMVQELRGKRHFFCGGEISLAGGILDKDITADTWGSGGEDR